MTDRNRRPTIVASLIWRETDDGIVVVDPASGKVRVFNGVGSVVWKMVDQRRSIAEIEQAMSERYQIDRTRAADDLKSFLQELDSRGLIVWQT